MNPTLLKKVIVGETDKNEFAYSGFKLDFFKLRTLLQL